MQEGVIYIVKINSDFDKFIKCDNEYRDSLLCLNQKKEELEQVKNSHIKISKERIKMAVILFSDNIQRNKIFELAEQKGFSESDIKILIKKSENWNTDNIDDDDVDRLLDILSTFEDEELINQIKYPNRHKNILDFLSDFGKFFCTEDNNINFPD